MKLLEGHSLQHGENTNIIMNMDLDPPMLMGNDDAHAKVHAKARAAPHAPLTPASSQHGNGPFGPSRRLNKRVQHLENRLREEKARNEELETKGKNVQLNLGDEVEKARRVARDQAEKAEVRGQVQRELLTKANATIAQLQDAVAAAEKRNQRQNSHQEAQLSDLDQKLAGVDSLRLNAVREATETREVLLCERSVLVSV